MNGNDLYHMTPADRELHLSISEFRGRLTRLEKRLESLESHMLELVKALNSKADASPGDYSDWRKGTHGQ